MFAPPADATTVEGGCVSTRVWKGSIPAELEAAAGNNAPHGLPVAIAQPANLAGFIFGYPLTAGRTEPANKILWVVATPRTGDLIVDGHPSSAATPAIHYTLTPNSFPGDIYPSIIDVPTAGCWHFTFGWNGRVAAIDLEYR